jgi:uncharacterized protein YidB (DUF937 family)
MDFMSIASDLLGSDSKGDIAGALSGLMGEGGLDSIVNSMKDKPELASMVSSWLGDGENMPISTDELGSLFDSDQISSFASNLGVDSSDAMSKLSELLPSFIDKSSAGGSLLDNIGGLDDAMDMAKKFFS